MGLGIIFVLISAGGTVGLVTHFTGEYGPAFWLISVIKGENGARMVLAFHHGIGIITVGVLLAQSYVGYRGNPVHASLARTAIPLWLFFYVSGMFLLP